MIKLTANGEAKVKQYINELWAKRKEILDAQKDTADETTIPEVKDIISDIETFLDEDGDYCNNWGVTDNYNSDYPLCLCARTDFKIVGEFAKNIDWYHEIIIAFKTKDWDNEVYPELRKLYFTSLTYTTMEDYIEDFLEPDLFLHHSNFTILKWNDYKGWIYSKLDTFFCKMAKKYDCDYVIINHENEVFEGRNYDALSTFDIQESRLMVYGQPCLGQSWRIIAALTDILKEDHNYNEQQIREAIQKHAKNYISDSYNLSLIK